MPSIRRGFAPGASGDEDVAARTNGASIDSRNGSERAMPAPCRKRRRGKRPAGGYEGGGGGEWRFHGRRPAGFRPGDSRRTRGKIGAPQAQARLRGERASGETRLIRRRWSARSSRTARFHRHASDAQFHIESLDPAKHRREAFDCGAEFLNRYLREQARLDLRRRAAGCWVLVANDAPSEILGYYTLSPESVLAAELPTMPKPEQRQLAPYARLGAWLLGRLAVAAARHGEGLGGLLLTDALRRCLRSEIPAVFVVVDPKDAAALAFYRKFGFRPLTATRMFMPMHEAASLFAGRPGN